MDIDGRVTVITGGASGIGAASCRAFAGAGARVAVVDRDVDGATKVADEIDGIAVQCEVGDDASVDAAFDDVVRRLGPVEICFNNAGIATGGDPLVTDPSVWDDQWHVNVMAHVYAIRKVLPAMLDRGEGYLLHTASMAGILTSHGNATYAATKHAVVGLAEWMSITYHDRGVRTSLLAPLGVRTPMLDAHERLRAACRRAAGRPGGRRHARRRRRPRGAVPDPHGSDPADLDRAQDRGRRALAARHEASAAAARE